MNKLLLSIVFSVVAFLKQNQIEANLQRLNTETVEQQPDERGAPEIIPVATVEAGD